MSLQLDEIKALHPGNFLQEQLNLEKMSQHDLAVRTGVTEKHISTIISLSKGISASFAKKLEYALNKSASYWIEKQADYDYKMVEFCEENEITREELNVLKVLKEIIDYYKEHNLLDNSDNEYETVLKLRRLMKVSNLLSIPNITLDAAYRTQVRKNTNIEPYVLYAWQRTCELLTEKTEIAEELNVDLLRDSLGDIRQLMFENRNTIEKKLEAILSKCGIAFKIVRNFVGAPVQGFIKQTDSGRIILCITLRGKRADGFWFTLFHEIGHIVNGDYNSRFVDVKTEGSLIEIAADTFARECLLSDDNYNEFVNERDFSLSAIKKFARKQGVKPFIVIGRLQKDEYLEWGTYDSEIEKYDWAIA